MPVPAGPGDQGAFLVQARKLYMASKFKAALVHFKMASSTNALVKCSCNRDMVLTAKKLGISLKEISIPTCHCKDLNALSLAPNPDKLAMYNLATKPCTCGSGLVSCDLPAHLGAIEGIAAAYDKLQAHSKALKYASLYIMMAPHVPEGYLRMAKALRLMDTSQSSNTNSRCTWIYHQALQSVRTYGNKNHEKLKILYSLLRKDIIVSLPTELQAMALQYLSQAELCRCMRVNKSWNRASRNPSLWKDLRLVKNWSALTPRPLRPGVLNDIILNRAAKLVKNLVIRGMRDFGIDVVKLRSILRALPQLQTLQLRGSDPALSSRTSVPSYRNVLDALFQDAPPSLRTLHVEDFFEDPSDRGYEDWAIPPDAPLVQTLQELTFSNLSDPLYFLGHDGTTPTVWPKLEKLVVSCEPQIRNRPQIDFLPLMTAMPALKDVSIIGCNAPSGPTKTYQFSDTASWDTLERFVLRKFVWERNRTSNIPRLPPGLRVLDVGGNPIYLLIRYKLVADEYEKLTGERLPLALKKLEHLRLSEFDFHLDNILHRTVMEVMSWWLSLLAPSISNGTLTSLDIPFDDDIQAQFDQLLDKRSICSFSCNGLPPPPSFQPSGLLNPKADALLTWLEGFPKLTTVGLFPRDREVCAMMVAKLLAKESNIRTIYTNELVGVYWDDALEKAKSRGIDIIRAERVPEPVLKPLDKESNVQGVSGNV